MPPPVPIDRRKFAAVLAAGGLPVVASSLASNSAAEEKSADQKASKKDDDPKPLAPADLLLELVRQQYPDQRLDAASLAEIRQDLEGQFARSMLLSNFPLKNSDEPAFVQNAWRGE